MPISPRGLQTFKSTHVGSSRTRDLAPPVPSWQGTLRKASTAMDWTPRPTPYLQSVGHGLRGYEAALPLGAKWLDQGEWRGTFESGTQHFIAQNQHFYAVYRRPGEGGLRLRQTAQKRYEPLVRLDDQGTWTVQVDTGVRLGQPSSAQALLQRSHGLSLRQAQDLLAGFEFQPGHKASAEQAVAQSLATQGQIPVWAHAYWKGPQPFTLPSKEAVSLGEGYLHLTPQVFQAELAPASSNGHSPIMEGPSSPGGSAIVDVPSSPVDRAMITAPSSPARQAIRIGDELHESPSPALGAPAVFLKPHESSLAAEWMTYETFKAQIISGHQPLPFTLQADGSRQVGAPLFGEPIDQTLSRVFPNLSPHTIDHLARHIYIRAGLDRDIASHSGAGIFRLRTLLDVLQSRKVIEAPAPRDLLGQLSPLLMKKKPNTSIWSDNRQLERLEFELSPAQQALVETLWQGEPRSKLSLSQRTRIEALRNVDHQSTFSMSQRNRLRSLGAVDYLCDIGAQIMRNSGYEVLHISETAKRKSGFVPPFVVFQRAATGEVFVMKVSEARTFIPTLTEPQRAAIQLNMPPGLAARIEQTRQDDKLYWLVGGVHNPPSGHLPVSRYFSVFRVP